MTTDLVVERIQGDLVLVAFGIMLRLLMVVETMMLRLLLLLLLLLQVGMVVVEVLRLIVFLLMVTANRGRARDVLLSIDLVEAAVVVVMLTALPSTEQRRVLLVRFLQVRRKIVATLRYMEASSGSGSIVVKWLRLLLLLLVMVGHIVRNSSRQQLRL